MVRRLQLAQALVNRPALLVLDEPTVGLDPVARDGVWERARGMREEYETSVLLATHYPPSGTPSRSNRSPIHCAASFPRLSPGDKSAPSTVAVPDSRLMTTTRPAHVVSCLRWLYIRYPQAICVGLLERSFSSPRRTCTFCRIGSAR